MRGKLVSTVSYFEDMIKDHCYIKGLSMVSLGKNDQTINVNLSSKTFTYKQQSYTRFHS